MMQPSNHWRIQMESLHSTADEDSNYVCMGCYQEVSENESIVCMICGRAWHACCALHHQPFASSTLGSLNQEWVCPLHGAMHQPQGDEFPLTLRSITSLEQLTKGDALLILQGPGEWAYGWVQRLNVGAGQRVSWMQVTLNGRFQNRVTISPALADCRLVEGVFLPCGIGATNSKSCMDCVLKMGHDGQHFTPGVMGRRRAQHQPAAGGDPPLVPPVIGDDTSFTNLCNHVGELLDVVWRVHFHEPKEGTLQTDHPSVQLGCLLMARLLADNVSSIVLGWTGGVCHIQATHVFLLPGDIVRFGKFQSSQAQRSLAGAQGNPDAAADGWDAHAISQISQKLLRATPGHILKVASPLTGQTVFFEAMRLSGSRGDSCIGPRSNWQADGSNLPGSASTYQQRRVLPGTPTPGIPDAPIGQAVHDLLHLHTDRSGADVQRLRETTGCLRRLSLSHRVIRAVAANQVFRQQVTVATSALREQLQEIVFFFSASTLAAKSTAPTLIDLVEHAGLEKYAGLDFYKALSLEPNGLFRCSIDGQDGLGPCKQAFTTRYGPALAYASACGVHAPRITLVHDLEEVSLAVWADLICHKLSQKADGHPANGEGSMELDSVDGSITAAKDLAETCWDDMLMILLAELSSSQAGEVVRNNIRSVVYMVHMNRVVGSAGGPVPTACHIPGDTAAAALDSWLQIEPQMGKYSFSYENTLCGDTATKHGFFFAEDPLVSETDDACRPGSLAWVRQRWSGLQDCLTLAEKTLSEKEGVVCHVTRVDVVPQGGGSAIKSRVNGLFAPHQVRCSPLAAAALPPTHTHRDMDMDRNIAWPWTWAWTLGMDMDMDIPHTQDDEESERHEFSFIIDLPMDESGQLVSKADPVDCSMLHCLGAPPHAYSAAPAESAAGAGVGALYMKSKIFHKSVMPHHASRKHIKIAMFLCKVDGPAPDTSEHSKLIKALQVQDSGHW
jgi:hypothetical protein